MPKINPGRILYEDEHLLAVNKLGRELVVRGSGPVQKLPLLDFLRRQYGERLTPIHRLDFETSGVILFAKTQVCYEEAVLKKKFMGHKSEIRKIYRAIVKGKMRAGKTGMIEKNLPSRSGEKLIPSKTHYQVLDVFRESSYVEAEISSGRHHQIRKHFASIGHPLALDPLYGDETFNHFFEKEYGYHFFFLHAFQVYFDHFVTQKPVMVEAPLLETLVRALVKLKQG